MIYSRFCKTLFSLTCKFSMLFNLFYSHMRTSYGRHKSLSPSDIQFCFQIVFALFCSETIDCDCKFDQNQYFAHRHNELKNCAMLGANLAYVVSLS